MKKLFQIGLLFLFATPAVAQEAPAHSSIKVLHVYGWKDLSARFTNCQIVSMDGISVLKIENTNNVPLDVLLLTITNSPLIQKAHIIEWEMKYKNVSFGSRRELFEKFPPQAIGGDNLTNYQGNYFSGTRNWDKYDFYIQLAPYDNETHPNELRLKLSSLPATGTVFLRPIKLLGIVSNFNSWWTPQQSGLIGGIGGALIGCFGGLIGLLVSRGRARNFVLAAVKCFIALGILLTIAGLVAVVFKQPYAIWYALLLPGVILILVFSLNLHSIQRRYDELEIRRMASVDVMRG